MNSSTNLISVYAAGEVTVVGFGDHAHMDFINLTDCQQELLALIRQNKVRTLAFDLSKITMVPSGMLGMIASMHKLVKKVLVFNPCEEIRDIFEITKLGNIVKICYVEIDA